MAFHIGNAARLTRFGIAPCHFLFAIFTNPPGAFHIHRSGKNHPDRPHRNRKCNTLLLCEPHLTLPSFYDFMSFLQILSYS